MTTRLIDRVRRPEYIGENRCIPCTVLNVGLALVLAAIIGAVAWTALGPLAAAIGGLAVLAVSSAAIALRGYLIPGTPTITRRYFPEWLLARFDKLPEEPAQTAGRSDSTVSPEDVDPERILLDAGAVEPCENEDDLCLTERFERAWTERAAEVDPGMDPRRIAAVLGIDGTPSVEEYDGAFAIEVDGTRVGQWESEAAMLADLASADVLAEQYAGWKRLQDVERGRVLGGLRVFFET